MARFTLTILSLVLVSVMVRLGFWQLDRSGFKSQRQYAMHQRAGLAPVDVGPALLDPEKMDFYRAAVSGRYLDEKGFLIDNVVHDRQPGVNVITPLQIENSNTLILVNRGWQPWGVDRVFLPDVDTPGATVSLNGLLVPAAEDHFYLENPDESGERRQLWPQLDLHRFVNSVNQPVQPLILVLDSGEPGAYQFVWKMDDDIWILRHKAYALQWFGLALALFVITVILLYQSVRGRSG